MATTVHHEIEVNEQQYAVLQWIADGCPDGVMLGYTHRISAAALRSRGLVRTSGRGQAWRAELTDLGQARLSAGPRPPRPQRPRVTRPPTENGAVRAPATDPGVGEQLVAEVIAAGGTLVLDAEASRGIDWRQRAYAAQRHGNVPEGKRLTVTLTRGSYEISLRHGATGNEEGADEITVPAQLRRYHPAVQTFRERTAIHEVSRRSLPRALRILHALSGALDERGFRVKCAELQRDRGYESRTARAESSHLIVSMGAHDFGLRIWEKGVGRRGRWEERKAACEESRRAMRFDPWNVGRIEAFDKGGTGELNIALQSHSSRQSAWGDRKRWTLDARLPQIVRELQTLALEAQERKERLERERAQRQRAWEDAMAEAERQALLAHKTQILTQRVNAWREADEIRSYCESLELRFGAESLSTEGKAWVDFARERADELQRMPTMPVDPELRPDDLKPFLGRWSPYGAEASHRW